MQIPDGYTDLPPGTIASVVTYLEMHRPRQVPEPGNLPAMAVRHVTRPALDWYRSLYRAIGADWLWFSRLEMSDDTLLGIIRDPQVVVLVLSTMGRDVGIAELDARNHRNVELTVFGLLPDLHGRGLGRFLMQRALAAAWRAGADRVWLHTCTLDHPRALTFYRRAGFVPFKRAIEIADDPRLRGLLPDTAAAHVPLIARQS